MKHQTSNFIRAFLRGFTGAGLFRRLGQPREFVAFHSHSIEDLYDSCAVVCGVLIHLATIAGSGYLFLEGHAKAASVLLGYEILLVISGFTPVR
jgi:hypothetical protein